jgi:hypothetical protein
MENERHPWQVFLNARKLCIHWLHENGLNDDLKIAEILSMDEMQVYLIRTWDQNLKYFSREDYGQEDQESKKRDGPRDG